jgi:hypothetical protein
VTKLSHIWHPIVLYVVIFHHWRSKKGVDSYSPLWFHQTEGSRASKTGDLIKLTIFGWMELMRAFTFKGSTSRRFSITKLWFCQHQPVLRIISSFSFFIFKFCKRTSYRSKGSNWMIDNSVEMFHHVVAELNRRMFRKWRLTEH